MYVLYTFVFYLSTLRAVLVDACILQPLYCLYINPILWSLNQEAKLKASHLLCNRVTICAAGILYFLFRGY